MNKCVLLLLLAILASSACGCATPERAQQILLLKNLSDNQRWMREYVDAQDHGFDRLCRDIAANRLRPGISKQRVVEKYSEPIYCKELYEPGKQEICVFRHPSELFFSDKVYLYFDHRGQLTEWKFQPR